MNSSACILIGSFRAVIIRSLPCDVIARAHLASLYSKFAWRNPVTKSRLYFSHFALVSRHLALERAQDTDLD